MGNISAKNLGIRLILTTVLGLVILSGYFIASGYSNYTKLSEKGVLNRLKAIATTLSLSIDADAHAALLHTYQGKDAITANGQDSIYHTIHRQLITAKQANGVSTDVYTLFYDSASAAMGSKMFSFGVTSGENPYFRHHYDTYPEVLEDQYAVGGMVPKFEDEHGMWLSAFAPLKTSSGAITGVVVVDQHFDEFVEHARSEAMRELLISLGVFLVLTGIIFYIIREIVITENENKQKLAAAYAKVERQNNHIRESITYARRIQTSIIPNEADIKGLFKDAFMFYEARDVVSGDFPWLFQKGDDIYIAVVDCTGHGVPGAMMSFIGYFLLNEINGHDHNLSPALILDKLHEAVQRTLKQSGDRVESQDGMDVALCKINRATNTVEYAGAHRPLYLVKDKALEQMKGDRKAIGGKVHAKNDKPFTNYTFEVGASDSIYFFSDGLPDQFGGPTKRSKYSPRRIREVVTERAEGSMASLKQFFETDFTSWKGDVNQFDDVLMIGIKF